MATKNTQLQIRVTSAEKAAIRNAAERAGMEVSTWVLDRLLPPAGRRFQELTQLLVSEPAQRRFTLAALNDLLTDTDATGLSESTAEPPTAQLDAYMANYVAAMVETSAHRHGIQPPEWTGTIAPLERPAFGSPLQSLRLHLLLSALPAFRRRNIFVDSGPGDRV